MKRSAAIGGVLAALLAAGCQVVTGLSNLEVTAEVGGKDAGEPRKLADASEPDASDASDEPDAEVDAGPPCPRPSGVACDVVEQCGCKQGQHCQALGDALTPTCTSPGKNAADSACKEASDCPLGQTCDSSVCRSYCAGDDDCAAGSCAAAAGSDGKPNALKVCWRKCEIGKTDACAKGTTCTDGTPPGGKAGPYCIAPADPCPTTENGKCDEAKGTGRCAEGTDEKDCNCSPSLPGAKCDHVAQCGCQAGESCMPTDQSALCFPPRMPTKARGDTCTSHDECPTGMGCTLADCQPFCTTSQDCGDGSSCRDTYAQDGTPIDGVRMCVTDCDRATGAATCKPGLSCVTLDTRFPQPGAFCTPQLEQCPARLTSDLICDEPEGSGLCAEGGDPEACCTISAPNQCNPVQQCGCETVPNTSCRHAPTADGTYTARCLPHDSVAAEQFCVVDEKCAPGTMCVNHVCREYCDAAHPCEGGQCLGVSFGGVAVPDLNVCLVGCDATHTCQARTSCIALPDGDPPLDYCEFVPLTDCERYRMDAECDEPEGTGLCVEGSDSEDCA